jgi:hypothetical protein
MFHVKPLSQRGPDRQFGFRILMPDARSLASARPRRRGFTFLGGSLAASCPHGLDRRGLQIFRRVTRSLVPARPRQARPMAMFHVKHPLQFFSFYFQLICDRVGEEFHPHNSFRFRLPLALIANSCISDSSSAMRKAARQRLPRPEKRGI